MGNAIVEFLLELGRRIAKNFPFESTEFPVQITMQAADNYRLPFKAFASN
jgi:hypothetical protein